MVVVFPVSLYIILCVSVFSVFMFHPCVCFMLQFPVLFCSLSVSPVSCLVLLPALCFPAFVIVCPALMCSTCPSAFMSPVPRYYPRYFVHLVCLLSVPVVGSLSFLCWEISACASCISVFLDFSGLLGFSCVWIIPQFTWIVNPSCVSLHYS